MLDGLFMILFLIYIFFSFIASEMEDLRKVVADLKELGDKVGIAYITSLLMCTTNVFTQLNLIIADFEVKSGKR